MPTTPTRESAGSTQTKIVVPGSQAMVSLLGSRDELLRIIEEALASDIHVRGNEITISGDAADNALAVRLFEELLELVARAEQADHGLRAGDHDLGLGGAFSGRCGGHGSGRPCFLRTEM